MSRCAEWANGDGFWNDGTTTLTNATLANNSTVAGMGGALWNDGVLLLDSGTVAGDGASGGGGTSNNASGTVEVRNTILAANTPDNCSGGIVSDGNNIDSGSSCTPTVARDLSNTDPLLGALQYNPPGPAFLETRAPLAGSPAIDAAAGCPPPSTDERGVVRPQGASCEIGAVEASPVTATSREDCGNCVDDDGDGRTDYEDPACCAQTAAMQVKKALIVPGPAGAMRGNLSLTPSSPRQASPTSIPRGTTSPSSSAIRMAGCCAPTSLISARSMGVAGGRSNSGIPPGPWHRGSGRWRSRSRRAARRAS